MDSDDITIEDVREIRHCAEELQIQNVKRYGEPGGVQKIRTVSQRTLAIADKLEAKLKL